MFFIIAQVKNTQKYCNAGRLKTNCLLVENEGRHHVPKTYIVNVLVCGTYRKTENNVEM
jgi:hypothetical protein